MEFYEFIYVDDVDFCKNRWKTLRRCFFQGLRRRGNKYYLHEHLEFLKDQVKKKPNGNQYSTFNEETNSNNSDSMQKNYDDGLSLQESETEIVNIYDDDDEAKSISSHTTSADEAPHMLGPRNKAGVFIIDELEDNIEAKDKSLAEERRLNYKRSCKRHLDSELIKEFNEEVPEEKRTRKSVTEKCKTLGNEKYPVRRDKLRLNIAKNMEDSKQCKMIDRSTCTDRKDARDVATQYEQNCSDFDDIFMQSIRAQLLEMNPRQKMNFKRKIYESLLEVFDDGTDFPKLNGTIQLPIKQPPRVINSTAGELRLMRELVALVQAAKNTPEIINANEKVTASTSVENLSNAKRPIPMSPKSSSPMCSSPALDDDDLQFSIDNIESDDITLPRSWDEIKAKVTEPSKASGEDSVIGLPRRLLQKMVKVSGSGTSTIVARDGEKKRIYRIYPKLISPNSNESETIVNKNMNNVGTFFVASKNCPDNNKSTTARPYVLTSSKNPKETAVSSVKNGVSNMRPLKTNETINSTNKTNQPITLSVANSNITNGSTIFKNIHPANRILSSSTGYFKTVPSSYIQRNSNVPSITTKKILTAKLPINPMMPPTSNITFKRSDVSPQLMQRRYSICGLLPAEKHNTISLNSAATAAKSSIATNNSKTEENSPVPHIKISEAVSLNTNTMNSQNSTRHQNISSNNSARTAAVSTATKEDIKTPNKSVKMFRESVSSLDAVTSTSISAKSMEIPIIETAGTVEADILDPLYVKPATIKSEPLDD